MLLGRALCQMFLMNSWLVVRHSAQLLGWDILSTYKSVWQITPSMLSYEP